MSHRSRKNGKATDLTRKIAPTPEDDAFNEALANNWRYEETHPTSPARTGNLMTPRKPGKFVGHSSKES